MNWQLQQAKNRLSEVVKAAESKGPQVITVRGKDAAVIVSVRDYQRMRGKGKPLGDLLWESPLRGSKLKIERSKELGRKVEL